MSSKQIYEQLKKLFPKEYQWAVKKDFKSKSVTANVYILDESHAYAGHESSNYRAYINVYVWDGIDTDVKIFSSTKSPAEQAYKEVEQQIKEYLDGGKAIQRKSIFCTKA